MMAKLAKFHQYRITSYLRDLSINSGRCVEFKTDDFIYSPKNYRNKLYAVDTAIFSQCADHQIQDDFKYTKTVIFDKCNKEFMSKNYNPYIFPNVENIILASYLMHESDIYNFNKKSPNIFVELPIFFQISKHLYPSSTLSEFHNINYINRSDIDDFIISSMI
jgi:hypothetical protein